MEGGRERKRGRDGERDREILITHIWGHKGKFQAL
jgi:hypothetical protein